jgi:quinol-cytochrome oxidoreductase complex cytochrome b subunit
MSEEPQEELHVKFFPYQIMLETTALLVIAGILLLAANYPAELGPQYDPMNPPSHLVPEWYFMPIYMVLKTEGLGAPIIGFMTLNIILLGLIAMPFLDKSKHRHPLRRPKSTITGIFLGAELAALWYLGENIAPGEISMLLLGFITILILSMSIIFVHLTRTIYFRHGYLEEN